MPYLEKNFKNEGNQKIILADKANFSFDFGNFTSFFAIVFSPISTATSCQDADFFPGMMYMHLERLERQAGRE